MNSFLLNIKHSYKLNTCLFTTLTWRVILKKLIALEFGNEIKEVQNLGRGYTMGKKLRCAAMLAT